MVDHIDLAYTNADNIDNKDKDDTLKEHHRDIWLEKINDMSTHSDLDNPEVLSSGLFDSLTRFVEDGGVTYGEINTVFNKIDNLGNGNGNLDLDDFNKLDLNEIQDIDSTINPSMVDEMLNANETAGKEDAEVTDTDKG